MAELAESGLDQARRHVAEAEQRVAEQLERIEWLRVEGLDARAAEKLYAAFKQTLQSMRDHLVYEEQRAQDRQRREGRSRVLPQDRSL